MSTQSYLSNVKKFPDREFFVWNVLWRRFQKTNISQSGSSAEEFIEDNFKNLGIKLWQKN